MSQPWWGRESDRDVIMSSARLVNSEFGRRPKLLADVPSEITAEFRSRRAAYVPEWIDPPEQDAGGALLSLFATQYASVARRANRLPDKALVDFLTIAGVQLAPERAATAMVQFGLAPAASESVPLLRGFQVGADPATGDGDLVVFETQDDHFISPGELTKVVTMTAGTQRDVSPDNENVESTFSPLGDSPAVGDALVIGIQLPATSRITNTISLGIRIATPPGSPPPISAGGVAPLPLPASPVLRWEARTANQFQPVDVLRDETANLWRSGIVTFRVPAGLAPSQFIGDAPLVWLRLRLIHGGFASPPELSFIRLNMARVDAVRTIHDEVLAPIDGSPNQMRLLNTPVVPNSLVLEIEDSVLSDSGGGNRASVQRWKEVDELFSASPTDQVFVVDPLSGVVTFGDGVHGAKVPQGFRNVHAAAYKVGSGEAGAVGADEITTLLNTAQFLTEVSNPLPASGGVDRERTAKAIQRGPETIRAGHRSVTVADYAVLAKFAPGADVRKAHAISGYHPSFRGQRLPGIVGVLVVPAAEETGPPIPDEQALRAVSEYLSREVAPMGVEVVAIAPTFRTLRVEIRFVANAGVNTSTTAQQLASEFDRYIDPFVGGNDGEGWPFGGTLFFSELLQHLLTNVSGVRAIPRMRLIVDGVPQARCGDVPLRQTELFWSRDHQIIPTAAEDAG